MAGPSEPTDPFGLNPTDLEAVVTEGVAAQEAAEELETRAMMMGYNVTCETVGEIAFAIHEPRRASATTFHVWRIDDDLTQKSAQIFITAHDVEHHLDYLESLPMFALQLVGKPEVAEDKDEYGAFTVTVSDDEGTRVTVALMRIQDIEASQQLFIRAEPEDRPTIGNWREVD